ncbi:MAG: hypothetical protein ABW277_09180 [Longimicrobiaceae bacterium]
MYQTDLKRRLAEYLREDGRYSPFTYTIGLRSSILDAEASIRSYPLPNPLSNEDLSEFLRSLTFFHEWAHLCQFLTTAYGLRVLRYTIVCLRNLSRCESWQMPIVSTLLNRLTALSAHEMTTLEGALIFLDAMDQLRLDVSSVSTPPMEPRNVIDVEFLPWSPHFIPIAHQSLQRHRDFAEEMVNRGTHIRKLPVLHFRTAKGEYRIVLNVAVLMEAYAVLVEMNHIYNALGLSAEEVFTLLPKGDEYHVLIVYMIYMNYCDWSNLLPTLGVCIDAAMMYDPFVLYDVPWDVSDEQGRGDQYPGETFLTICGALRNTAPITEHTPEDTSRFYKELCANAGLPAPEWMATRSSEVANSILNQSRWQDTLMGCAVKAHADALNFRCDTGAAFPHFLPTTGWLNEFVQLAGPAVSFFDLGTRQPNLFDPRKVDAVTVHSLLLQAFVSSDIQCPLKEGDPFYCPSAGLPHASECVWRHEGGTRECLLGTFIHAFGISPAERREHRE